MSLVTMGPADDRAIGNRTTGNRVANNGIDDDDVVDGVVAANNYTNDGTADNEQQRRWRP